MVLERRSFLKAALALVLPLPACSHSETVGAGSTSVSAGKRVAWYFDELESARVIARAWLGDRDPLEAATPTLDLLDGSESDEAALAAVSARLEQDFTTGATANVAGWTFGATELQLCAMALLD